MYQTLRKLMGSHLFVREETQEVKRPSLRGCGEQGKIVKWLGRLVHGHSQDWTITAPHSEEERRNQQISNITWATQKKTLVKNGNLGYDECITTNMRETKRLFNSWCWDNHFIKMRKKERKGGREKRFISHYKPKANPKWIECKGKKSLTKIFLK